jgi:hypothetical protein
MGVWWLGAQQCDKRCIVEPQRALPETVQFHRLPEYVEAVKLRLPLEQLRDGGGDVGQIGPSERGPATAGSRRA